MLVLGLCLAALPASAASLSSGRYVVRYSVVNSLQIPPEVARANSIERRGNRAIITITLQQPTEEQPLNAVPAEVAGTAQTLLGAEYELNFRRVRAAGSVYSLAAVPLPEGQQTMTFELVITTTDGSRLIPLRFTRTLYRRS